MAGTKIGAERHRRNMILKFGSEKKWKEFMVSIGSKGGTNSPRPGGFNYQPKEKVSEAGRKGGKVSKRRAKK